MKKLALLGVALCLALSTVSSATMLREIWYEQVTGTLDEAVAVATSGEAPTQTDVLDDSGWPGDEGVNYVSKLSGFVVVPADGEYTFYISGDDHCGLWVSQDTTPADPLVDAPVAYVDGWTNWLEWTTNDSQKAAPMTLAAGQVISVFAIHREGSGGDNLSIGWTGPGIDEISMLGANVTHLAYQAGLVAPADGATGIVEVTAEWMAPPLVEDPVYNVYGGTDPAALDLLAEGITETTLPYGSAGAELDFETTYYWRVDVVGQEPGNVWSFTTQTGKPVITAVRDAAVLPGEDAQLAVEVMSLGGDTTYQWYRAEVEMMGIVLKDVPLPEGVGPVLDVPQAQIGDEGDYYCVVTNDLGSTTSDMVILDVQVGLIHRYSFTEDASDSVGDADGVLVNNTGNAAYVDGQLVLGNDGSQSNDSDTGDYVDLPNGLISKLTQITVNVWATYTDESLAIWSRVLSFGESDDGEDSSREGSGSTYVTIQPNRNGNVAGIEYRNKGAVNEFTLDGRVPLDEEILYTWVHDDITGLYKLYLNGIVQNGRATNVTLKEFNDVNVWLGRGQWNDPLFVGSFNECRIYDTALTAEEIALSYLAGPDELPVLPEPCPVDIAGDLNNDCVMDIVDAAILADQFLMQTLQD